MLTPSSVGNSGNVIRELFGIQEAWNGRPFLRLLIAHQRSTHAAVRVAAAGERAPIRLLPLDHVRESGKRADKRNREPVARRLAFAHLAADVLLKVRGRVAVAEAACGMHFLVA